MSAGLPRNRVSLHRKEPALTVEQASRSSKFPLTFRVIWFDSAAEEAHSFLTETLIHDKGCPKRLGYSHSSACPDFGVKLFIVLCASSISPFLSSQSHSGDAFGG